MMLRQMVMVAMMGMATVAVADDKAAWNAYRQGVTVVKLDTEARREVAPDRVMATLTSEHTAPDAVQAQGKVNADAQQVKAAAGSLPGIRLVTGGYNVYRSRGPWEWEDGKRRRVAEEWTARQEFTLEGMDRERIVDAAAGLQKKGLMLQGISFYLSREATDKVKKELVKEAVMRMQDQARDMAGYLGMKDVRLAEIEVEDDGYGSAPRPVMAKAARMEMMADTGMPTPVAEPDRMEVEVRVRAEVHLK